MEQKTYDKHTAKCVAVMVENMPPLTSEVMQAWIQSPLALQRALKNALDVDLVGDKAPRAQLWKDLTINKVTAEDFYTRLFEESRIGADCEELLEQAQKECGLPEEERIKLARISVRELGFTKPVTFRKILERAAESGLALCHPLIAAHLRFQYDNLVEQEELYVACTPVKNQAQDDRHDMFCLYFTDEGKMTLDRALHEGEYLSSRLWNPDEEFVFKMTD